MQTQDAAKVDSIRPHSQAPCAWRVLADSFACKHYGRLAVSLAFRQQGAAKRPQPWLCRKSC